MITSHSDNALLGWAISLSTKRIRYNCPLVPIYLLIQSRLNFQISARTGIELSSFGAYNVGTDALTITIHESDEIMTRSRKCFNLKHCFGSIYHSSSMASGDLTLVSLCALSRRKATTSPTPHLPSSRRAPSTLYRTCKRC